jgi:hypothetical protein
MPWRSTTPDVSIPRVLFSMALLIFLVIFDILMTLLWSLVAWIPPPALLSCPRKQEPSAFWQADNVHLNFFGLFGECVCIHCFGYTLVSTFTTELQVSSPVFRKI